MAALGVAALVVGVSACVADEADPPETTAPPTTQTDTTSSPPPGPGEPCEPGTVDCVEDAWGDGVARVIVGYDECVGAIGDDGLCSDLDQDGYSGYPDSG